MINKIKKKLKHFFKSSYKNIENKSLLEEYKNYKKCYILGTSPSISNLNLLGIDNALIMTMGNFHEHPKINQISPHIHVFSASHPPITKSVLKNWWSRCEKLLPKDTRVLVEKRDIEIAKEVFKKRKYCSYSYGGSFPIDFTKKIISCGSVAQIAIQLAIFLKIKEINFAGINHDWQRFTPYKHFYSHDEPSLEYYLQKEGVIPHYNKIEGALPKEFLYSDYNLYQGYEKLKRYAEQKGIIINNVDSLSSFDVFQKVKDKKLENENY